MPSDKIVICKYFNDKGSCLHDIAVESPAGEHDLSGPTTSAKGGALALQALIAEVTMRRTDIDLARDIRAVSIQGSAPISVADALPELETTFGSTSVQWARAIFTHLKLKPPVIQ